MTPIPDEAKPVAALIRKHVKRPRKLPDYASFHGNYPRWCKKGAYRCPMGLLPGALFEAPINVADCGPLGKKLMYEQVLAFASWWDNRCPLEYTEAMDAIWGPRRRAKK